MNIANAKSLQDHLSAITVLVQQLISLEYPKNVNFFRHILNPLNTL